jgi:RNA polymerase sigma-70 factor (ECF subfamily)
MRSADEDGDDRALIEGFLGGDEKAFEALVDKHYERIDRLALRILGDGMVAEEIAQETFVRVYRGLSRFRGDASFHSWLYRITLNLCLTHLRHRTRRVVSPDVSAALAASQGTDPAARVEAEQRRVLVRHAVDALPPHYRIVVVLNSVEGLPYQEIAALLGVPLGTVKSRINVAKRLLREKLRHLLGPPDTTRLQQPGSS